MAQALIDGAPTSRVKHKMSDLKNRKAEIEARIKDGEGSTVRIHPDMRTATATK